MKKKKVHKEGRSLRTFFLYAFIVLSLILTSLSIKAVFLLRQSKFDGKNIVIAVTRDAKVVEIVGFNAIRNSVAVMKIEDDKISSENLGNKAGIIPDARIDVDSSYIIERPEDLLKDAALPDQSLKTDLTIFDSIRLIILSQRIQEKDRSENTIALDDSEGEIDAIVTDLFSDDTIIAENLSIHIVNATAVSGLGKQLERVMVNKGANVVAVSSTRDPESVSKIKYSKNGYTTNKLKKQLNLPEEKTADNVIADVTIIIGEDFQGANIR